MSVLAQFGRRVVALCSAAYNFFGRFRSWCIATHYGNETYGTLARLETTEKVLIIDQSLLKANPYETLMG